MLCALPGDDRVDAHDGGRDGEFEGGLEARPSLHGRRRDEKIKVREGCEGLCEAVACLVLCVALDAHEDGETVEDGEEGLIGRAVWIACRDVALDGLHSVREEVGEEEADVLGLGGIVSSWEVPVGELGHVVDRDGEDVEQALSAPGQEVLA